MPASLAASMAIAAAPTSRLRLARSPLSSQISRSHSVLARAHTSCRLCPPPPSSSSVTVSGMASKCVR